MSTETKAENKHFEITLYEDRQLAHPYATFTLEEIKSVWFINGTKVDVLPLDKLNETHRYWYKYWIDEGKPKEFALLYANMQQNFENTPVLSADPIVLTIVDDIFIRMYRGMKFPSTLGYADHIISSGSQGSTVFRGIGASIEWLTENMKDKLNIPPLS